MATSPSRRPFDFSANHVVLDFVNTVNGRPTYSRDDLAVIDDVLDWAFAAGIAQLPCGEIEPSQLRQVVALRESLYGVFGPIAHGEAPLPAALAVVTRRAARAMRSSAWARSETGFQPSWQRNSIDGLCDRLADDAVQLLRSDGINRIGSCAGCGWLFLDVSRAHARRWCSMNACGVRSKMRRYHQRQMTATSDL